jgi:hypothetical protein
MEQSNFDMRIVPHLVKKLPAFFGTQGFIIMLTAAIVLVSFISGGGLFATVVSFKPAVLSLSHYDRSPN